MTILRHRCESSWEITELCENANTTALLLHWDKEVIIPLGINFAMGIHRDLDFIFASYEESLNNVSFDKTVLHETKCLSYYIYLFPQANEVVPNHTLPLEGAHPLASKKPFSLNSK